MHEVNRLKGDSSPKKEPEKIIEDALNPGPDESANLKKKLKESE